MTEGKEHGSCLPHHSFTPLLPCPCHTHAHTRRHTRAHTDTVHTHVHTHAHSSALSLSHPCSTTCLLCSGRTNMRKTLTTSASSLSTVTANLCPSRYSNGLPEVWEASPPQGRPTTGRTQWPQDQEGGCATAGGDSCWSRTGVGLLLRGTSEGRSNPYLRLHPRLPG